MSISNNISTKPPVPPLIKIREVAQLLSVCKATVHGLIDTGELKASKVSPYPKKAGPSRKQRRVHVRITRESLLGFYERRFGHPLERALKNPFQS